MSREEVNAAGITAFTESGSYLRAQEHYRDSQRNSDGNENHIVLPPYRSERSSCGCGDPNGRDEKAEIRNCCSSTSEVGWPNLAAVNVARAFNGAGVPNRKQEIHCNRCLYS
jgi:hypothetical protein